MASSEASTAVGSLAAEDTTNTRSIASPSNVTPTGYTKRPDTRPLWGNCSLFTGGSFLGGSSASQREPFWLFCARSGRPPPRSHLLAHRWMLPRCFRSRDFFRFAIFLRYTGPPCFGDSNSPPPPSALRLSRPRHDKARRLGPWERTLFFPQHSRSLFCGRRRARGKCKNVF